MAAEENDDEEREDVPALAQDAAVIPSPRGETGVGTDMEPASAEMGSGRRGGRTAEEIMADRPGRAAGAPAEDESGAAVETLWKEGPVWSVGSVEPAINAAGRLHGTEEALRAVEAGGTETVETSRMTAGAERTVRTETEVSPLAGTRRAHQVQAGLEGLYRQTVQAARPAAPALPPEPAGRSVRAQEPGSAASLAVDELDRAVRRDSRRYDGGMSIF